MTQILHEQFEKALAAQQDKARLQHAIEQSGADTYDMLVTTNKPGALDFTKLDADGRQKELPLNDEAQRLPTYVANRRRLGELSDAEVLLVLSHRAIVLLEISRAINANERLPAAGNFGVA